MFFDTHTPSIRAGRVWTVGGTVQIVHYTVVCTQLPAALDWNGWELSESSQKISIVPKRIPVHFESLGDENANTRAL